MTDREKPSAVPASVVQEMLDGISGSVSFLLPVLGADGEVADFRIAAASAEAVDVGARRGKELVGLSVVETYPTVVGSSLWQGYLRALATGVAYQGEPFDYQEVLAGIPRRSRYAVRAAPCFGGLMVSWVRLDPGEREQRRLSLMQRLGRMGWVNRDLVRGTLTWSPEVYPLFERDPALGPITLEELADRAHEEDRGPMAEAVRRLLHDGEPLDRTFRIAVPGGELRHLRVVFEAERDAHGHPVETHGFFQDLTAAKEAEHRLLAHQREARTQRTRLAAERALAARLQDALLPVTQQSLHLADLTVDVAYRPLQDGLNLGGDWYSAVELPDGSALLVIGDVAGHGLDAVATMAQLRFTAKGMAVTESSLPTILTRLNTLLLHTAKPNFTTATMIMARYRPDTAQLTWAQAGHPPPLLVRGGRADFLPAPEGILLGADPGSRYAASTLQLLPGDQLLLYTDGLVETRDRPLDQALAQLAATAARAGDALSPDGLLREIVTPQTRRDDICVLHVSR
ncbi:PP2C family protein-serine/threonine phosphatase [Streptomyces sp. TLI_171]|uniref:PP2C family protein-serine/threonine phosphatase n=1 Tax=Streptomyces sp. TLI_171 TaxID=1938859 RepID=UPI000C18B822|nr:SpoIIE family protein phosphatase [Streptomyces sp. TLI_171]RKE17342.1 serine phosphatase RsbU (regulator of sigma subunit) [Streptomyces sp. TLI_171]